MGGLAVPGSYSRLQNASRIGDDRGVHWTPLLDRIDLPDLTTFSHPEWNDARSLSAAFDSILTANNEESSLNAYHRLLYAVGNDHAGTYYSVALGILPIIERILRDGSPWSQHTVLEVLIEL